MGPRRNICPGGTCTRSLRGREVHRARETKEPRRSEPDKHQAVHPLRTAGPETSGDSYMLPHLWQHDGIDPPDIHFPAFLGLERRPPRSLSVVLGVEEGLSNWSAMLP